ncbi:hypothetical protein J6590_084332 [Homalodisca vitripennis]|nr:hypothetical protein J6590_084332 [Homalodisca vitripennis]
MGAARIRACCLESWVLHVGIFVAQSHGCCKESREPYVLHGFAHADWNPGCGIYVYLHHRAMGAARSHAYCLEPCCTKPWVLHGVVHAAWNLSNAWSHRCCTEPLVLHGVVHATWNREYCMEPWVLHRAIGAAWSRACYLEPLVLHGAIGAAGGLYPVLNQCVFFKGACSAGEE